MKRLLPWLGYALAALLAAYFVWFVARSLDRDSLATLATPGVVLAVLAAAAMYALIIPVTAWAWTHLLARQGERWRPGPLAVLLARVQIAKYIPGNVAQHAGRAVLAMRAGMGGRVLAVTVLQETGLAVAASVLVGVAALLLSTAGLEQLPVDLRPLVFATGGVLGLGLLVLLLVDAPPERLARSGSRLLRLAGRLGGLPGGPVVARAVGAYSLNYVMIGAGLYLVARVAGLSPALDPALATAVFALSWLLGFLAPGAPAGVGVREGIMLLLLAPTVPAADAAAFVLLARLVTMVGDGLCYAASFLARARPPLQEPGSP